MQCIFYIYSLVLMKQMKFRFNKVVVLAVLTFVVAAAAYLQYLFYLI